MGRGKRLLKWLKKSLFSKKSSGSNKKKNNRKNSKKNSKKSGKKNGAVSPALRRKRSRDSVTSSLQDVNCKKSEGMTVPTLQAADQMNIPGQAVYLKESEGVIPLTLQAVDQMNIPGQAVSLKREREIPTLQAVSQKNISDAVYLLSPVDSDAVASADSLDVHPGESIDSFADYSSILGDEIPSMLKELDSMPEPSLVGCEKHLNSATLLPPIEEDYRNANITPCALPKPAHTTSRLGNVAFEVNLSEDERPLTARPGRFSVSDINREELGSRLGVKMEKAEQNRLTALKERSQISKKRSEHVEEVKSRKTATSSVMPVCSVKPIIHGSSLLEELPDTSDIDKRPASRGGVAFVVENTKSHHHSSAKPTWLLEVENNLKHFKVEEDDEVNVNVI